MEIYQGNAGRVARGHRFEPAQSTWTWTCQKSNFVQKFTGEMPDASLPAIVLCEPAESKCTWTCHKSRFVRKFTKKMPHASAATPVWCEPAQSKCTWTCHKPFCAEIYRELAAHGCYHLDSTPGFNCYRKNPSVWTHCLGGKINVLWMKYTKAIQSLQRK